MGEEYKEAQEAAVDTLERLSRVGGYLEKLGVISALKVLRPKVFDLSHEQVYKRARALEQSLCDELDGEWNPEEEICECKYTKTEKVCSTAVEAESKH